MLSKFTFFFYSVKTSKKSIHLESMMNKVILASVMMAFVLTGCNTFKGIGKDVSKAGDAVTNTAEKTEQKL